MYSSLLLPCTYIQLGSLVHTQIAIIYNRRILCSCYTKYDFYNNSGTAIYCAWSYAFLCKLFYYHLDTPWCCMGSLRSLTHEHKFWTSPSKSPPWQTCKQQCLILDSVCVRLLKHPEANYKILRCRGGNKMTSPVPRPHPLAARCAWAIGWDNNKIMHSV